MIIPFTDAIEQPEVRLRHKPPADRRSCPGKAEKVKDVCSIMFETGESGDKLDLCMLLRWSGTPEIFWW
ncbi:hypothetical protein MPTK1_7g09330 [Marchantia polymorpha subsp. ruderalis]|uniref:Uncharacterized protein n=2 Tax=Marchantia polymorpha TaxID=3197 RepID=A0AAF6BXR1_MARPO|nr:hypothetical protein MARPO_0068s0086 [Marchantia polymorpha]BBN16795.1 hypothetical protein Mp_7g09330 [Marchantia polymorpha subsp. ruderalis]|eukprot:PTQ35878.1 hypothetical protein MARPO_0068s0086 [Marchantia polymorpha]